MLPLFRTRVQGRTSFYFFKDRIIAATGCCEPVEPARAAEDAVRDDKVPIRGDAVESEKQSPSKNRGFHSQGLWSILALEQTIHTFNAQR